MDRRSLLRGIVGFVACAPAIVRADSLMRYSRVCRWPMSDAECTGGFLVPEEFVWEIKELYGVGAMAVSVARCVPFRGIER